jgi:hypothetical protein
MGTEGNIAKKWGIAKKYMVWEEGGIENLKIRHISLKGG